MDVVVAGAAVDEEVVAEALLEDEVVALAAEDRVVAVAAVEAVVARAAVDLVVAGAAVDLVDARAAEQPVGARVALQAVVAAVAEELVVAEVADQHVVARAAGQAVRAVAAEQQVARVRAGQAVGSRRCRCGRPRARRARRASAASDDGAEQRARRPVGVTEAHGAIMAAGARPRQAGTVRVDGWRMRGRPRGEGRGARLVGSSARWCDLGQRPAARARRTRGSRGEYPGSAAELCELDHESPYQLLVATILSAQSTDKMINSVTPKLFARYPDPGGARGRRPVELQEMIRSTGFFNAKSRSLMGMAQAVVERFDGEIPDRMADLVSLPGVGRKTANVVLSVAFGKPGLPVDTHVLRLSQRLGLTTRGGPGQGRARARPDGAGGRARPAVVPPHPPRPAGVRRAQAALRGLRARGLLPVVAAARSCGGGAAPRRRA